MPDIISPSPNEVLQALLNGHGYEAEIAGERVIISGHQEQMSGDVYFNPRPNPSQLQLDVRFHLPDGRTILESFAGVGDTMQYALGDAFNNFSSASFHVLLKALLGDTCDDASDVSSEEWELPSGLFTAWVGNLIGRGEPPFEQLAGWFERFADFIVQAPLNAQQSHWIRLYYAQHNRRALVCEALLDNQPWPALQRRLQAYSWPQSEAFYSVRIFLVLQPI